MRRRAIQLLSLCTIFMVFLLFIYNYHLYALEHQAIQMSVGKLGAQVASMDQAQATIVQTSTQQQKTIDILLELGLLCGQKHLGNVSAANSELLVALRAAARRQAHAELFDAMRARLKADVQALQTPASCNTAQYLACYMVQRPCGFACQMHTLADCMASGVLSGRTTVLLPAQFFGYGPECSHMWGCFFLPVSSCQAYAESISFHNWKPWSPDSKEPFAMYRAWGEDPYRTPSYLKQLEGQPFAQLPLVPTPACLFTGVLLDWCMRPNNRLRVVMQQRAQRLQLAAKLADVGFHVRRTDKVEQEASAFDLRYYVMHADHFLGTTAYHHAGYGRKYAKRILLVSDTNLREEAKGFPEYDWSVALAYQQDPWPRSSLDTIIADIFLLVNSTYFVGTLSSQVSRLVVELRAAADGGAHSFERLASLDSGYYKGVQPFQNPPTSVDPKLVIPL